MNIPIGRLLWIDTGDRKWGRVLYMAVNPPIVCETCNTVIFDWLSLTEQLICPSCENVVIERNFCPCIRCNEMDYMTLRVVNNNNWGYDFISGQVTEYNDKAGFTINVCKKELVKEITSGKIHLLSAKDTVNVKRKLMWTFQDEYDSTKSIPEWIIEKFKYEDQE